MSYNTSKVTVVGRIGADAEEPRKVGDSKVTDFRVCANVYRGKEKDQTPVWYKVPCWGAFADVVAKQAKKGTLVYVSGDLILEEYEGKSGKGSQLVILNSDVIFMDDGERPAPAQTQNRGGSPFGGRGKS